MRNLKKIRSTKKSVKATKKTKASKPTGSFKKKVLKVIHEQAESKQAYFNSGDSLIAFNSGISTASDMQQLVPNVSQGTSDNARIGDQLRSQSLNVRGFIRLYPKTQTGTLSNEPKLSNVACRVMILSMKIASNFDLAKNQANQLSSLLRKGGTTTAFTGVLSDLNAPINTEQFTVHHDSVHYLTQDYVFLPTTATYQNSAVAIDLKDSIKFFSINIKCKNKVFKYDNVASGGILPTNFAPFLVLGYSYLSGDSPDSLNTQVGLQYITTLNYEDM